MVKKHHSETLQKAIAEKKIDSLMIPISKFIANTKNYFTTSTCSGRITLMDLDENEAKKERAFFRKWHRPVTFSEVWGGIQDPAHHGNLWLKQDAFVFLIGTDTLAHAKELIQWCHDAGVKRAGINHFEEGKVHVEIFGTQTMSVPVKIDDEILVDKEYGRELVRIANRKWKLNDQRLKKFTALLKKKMK